MRRSDRLCSRARPHAVAVPAAPSSRLRPSRTDRKAGPLPEQATDVATAEQTRRTFEAAAKMVAKLYDGIRDRAVAHGPHPQPASTKSPQQQPQQPGAHAEPGRSTPTGGVA